MVKKLQKKCDQIGADVKLLRAQIKPNPDSVIPGVETSQLMAQMNQNATNALAEQNKNTEEKKASSQEVIDILSQDGKTD